MTYDYIFRLTVDIVVVIIDIVSVETGFYVCSFIWNKQRKASKQT
jgi:hypothetical protein